MSQHTVLFEANVLYPAPMRDALMQLAVTDLFKAKWTAQLSQIWSNSPICCDGVSKPEGLREISATSFG